MAGSAGPFQFMIPYGAASAACWVACYARRHMHDYGTTRTQLGAIAVNGRANAAANPKAIYTDPMTIDDYLAVRMVSDPAVPLRLRRALRRVHGGSGLAPRPCTRRARLAQWASMPWVPPSGAGPPGTSSTT